MRKMYHRGEWLTIVDWTDVNRLARQVWWGAYQRVNGNEKYALISALGLSWRHTLWHGDFAGNSIPNFTWWPIPHSEFDLYLNERFNTFTVRRARPVT